MELLPLLVADLSLPTRIGGRRRGWGWPSRRLGVTLTCAAVMLLGSTFVLAQSPTAATVTITGLEVGFGGIYKVGDWSPLAVLVETTAPVSVDLELLTPDSDDDQTRLPLGRHQLQPGQPQRLQGYFRVGKRKGEIVVRLSHDGHLVASQTWRPQPDGQDEAQPGLPHSTAVWGTLGHPAGLTSTSAGDKRTRETRVAACQSVAELPDQWFAYQTLDALVIAASALDPQGRPVLTGLTAAQDQALQGWVRNGGHLVISVGEGTDGFLNSPLAAWCPIKVTGQTRLRRLSSLEIYLGRPLPIPQQGPVPAAQLNADAGLTTVEGLSGPLIAQAAHGFGRVTFIALDLDRPPLSEWQGLSAVLARLLLPPEETPSSTQTGGTQLADVGVTDLSSQLLFTLDQFPQVPRASTWTVLGILLIYLLLIGPLDYFLVHRFLKRPQLTWITLPVQIVILAALIWWAADVSNGREMRSAQLNLLDIDAVSGQVRGQTWNTLYGARSQRQTVRLEPQLPAGLPAAQPVLSWNGLAENSIGGLYRQAGLQVARREYSYSADGGLEGVPLPVWSTKSLLGQWQGVESGLVDSKLESAGVGRLSGTISFHLCDESADCPAQEVTLENCILAYGNQVYFNWQRRDGEQVSVLAPFQVWDLERKVSGNQRELRGYLTQVMLERIKTSNGIGSEVQTRRTPYNPLSRDLDNLVKMMTFHGAAGGTSYTTLRHDVLAELDLSTHLRLGRAVLFGRIAAPAARLLVNGQPVEAESEQATYVRIVLPVRKLQVQERREFKNPGEGVQNPRP